MLSRSVRGLAAAALVLVALTLSPPPVQAAVVVRANTTTWAPSVVNIARGGAVKWSATVGTHNVKAWGGNWAYLRSLPHGATTAARAFPHAGTFRFYCTIHGYLANGQCHGMCGRIVVH
jgi:plastocyanin